MHNGWDKHYQQTIRHTTLVHTFRNVKTTQLRNHGDFNGSYGAFTPVWSGGFSTRLGDSCFSSLNLKRLVNGSQAFVYVIFQMVTSRCCIFCVWNLGRKRHVAESNSKTTLFLSEKEHCSTSSPFPEMFLVLSFLRNVWKFECSGSSTKHRTTTKDFQKIFWNFQDKRPLPKTQNFFFRAAASVQRPFGRRRINLWSHYESPLASLTFRRVV